MTAILLKSPDTKGTRLGPYRKSGVIKLDLKLGRKSQKKLGIAVHIHTTHNNEGAPKI